MPTTALVTATIEKLANGLLALDPASEKLLSALHNQCFTLFLHELPFALQLNFSNQIDVIALTEPFSDYITTLPVNECCVRTSLSTLPKLSQSSQLTRLIQHGELELEGDLHIAQRLSVLMNSLDIDWEEHLSRYVGDVAAHTVARVGEKLVSESKKAGLRWQKALANALVEEKQVAVHRLEIIDFADQVADLRDYCARTEARLNQLAKQIEVK